MLIQPGQQPGEDGRRTLQVGDAAVRQRLEHVGRIELAAHHQSGTGIQRGHEHRAQTEDGVIGQVGVGAVGRPELARFGGDAAKLQQAGVRDQHALGVPVVPEVKMMAATRSARSPVSATASDHTGLRQARQHRRPRAGLAGVLMRRIRHAAGEIDHARVGLFRKAGDLAARHARVHAARPRPHATAGQDQRHMLGAVRSVSARSPGNTRNRRATRPPAA